MGWFKPGQSMPVPVLPNYSGTLKEDKPKGDLLFTLLAHAQDGAPVPLEPYTLLKGGAEVAKGVTDALGQVVIKDHDPATTQYTVKLSDGRVYDLGVQKALASPDEKASAQGFRAAQGDSSKRNDEFQQNNRPAA